MVKGKALNNDEANQFIGGKKAKEEEKTYEGSPLQEVTIYADRVKKAF